MIVSAPREIKIVFTGPMGAGKTTAIGAISDIPPVNTDVENNDRASFDKDTTTTALDYGQIALDDGLVVRLYGTPGQERFAPMRKILMEGAMGIVLLVDAAQLDVLTQLDGYIDALRAEEPVPPLVVGAGRTQMPSATPVDQLIHRVERAGLAVPVFSVDVRRREDVALLVEALLCQIETGVSGGPFREH